MLILSLMVFGSSCAVADGVFWVYLMTGYVGLVNQAMTCYLNSLLQALYMTPEFRSALYKWEFDGTEAEAVKSIPYQLQKLFLNLQVSTVHSRCLGIYNLRSKIL
jgi:uncharacterized UBP type Zn finger protein